MFFHNKNNLFFLITIITNQQVTPFLHPFYSSLVEAKNHHLIEINPFSAQKDKFPYQEVLFPLTYRAQISYPLAPKRTSYYLA